MDSTAAPPTAPTDGKTRGLTWNSGTTMAQTITSTSNGAMNIAAPATELIPRVTHRGRVFWLGMTSMASP